MKIAVEQVEQDDVSDVVMADIQTMAQMGVENRDDLRNYRLNERIDVYELREDALNEAMGLADAVVKSSEVYFTYCQERQCPVLMLMRLRGEELQPEAVGFADLWQQIQEVRPDGAGMRLVLWPKREMNYLWVEQDGKESFIPLGRDLRQKSRKVLKAFIELPPSDSDEMEGIELFHLHAFLDAFRIKDDLEAMGEEDIPIEEIFSLSEFADMSRDRPANRQYRRVQPKADTEEASEDSEAMPVSPEESPEDDGSLSEEDEPEPESNTWMWWMVVAVAGGLGYYKFGRKS
jgi:hypothetical protein